MCHTCWFYTLNIYTAYRDKCDYVLFKYYFDFFKARPQLYYSLSWFSNFGCCITNFDSIQACGKKNYPLDIWVYDGSKFDWAWCLFNHEFLVKSSTWWGQSNVLNTLNNISDDVHYKFRAVNWTSCMDLYG